jgi:hypothetical protein
MDSSDDGVELLPLFTVAVSVARGGGGGSGGGGRS